MAESEARGHGKLLVKRQAKLAGVEQDLHILEHTRDQLYESLTALEPIGERADRDFRKQTIMTIRTLFLENALLAFLAVLVGHMHAALSDNPFDVENQDTSDTGEEETGEPDDDRGTTGAVESVVNVITAGMCTIEFMSCLAACMIPG